MQMNDVKYGTIEFERQGPIGVLTLNRPERLNAINGQMKREIADVLPRIEADEAIRVLILRGAGRAFCSGFDLQAEAEEEPAGVEYWRPELRRDFDVIMSFWYFPKPTISSIHTYALAGGFELAVACDITIAAEGTRVGEPELKFGSGIVALLLPWLTSPKKAKEIILTGNDRLDAREAEALGLINRVVPAGEEFKTAMAVARDIAVMDPDGVRLMKEAINRSYEIMGMGEALRMALDIDVELESLQTPDRVTFREISRAEGLKAAIAWRDARFSKNR